MTSVRWHIGDTLTVLRTLEADSVDLVLTSPPFLALRSYLPADHPDKGHEGGSQATPGEYLDWLLDVVEELDRVLAPHGSLCIELGDTYAGSGGAGGDYNPDGWREGQEKFNGSKWDRSSGRRAPGGQPYANYLFGKTQPGGNGWPLDKSLSLIPESFRWALAYGRNPFTGRETPRWRVRNVVRWVRPNPPVGALGDKFRPATTDLVVACKSRDRYFDLDAVRNINNPDRMDEVDSGSRRSMPAGLGNNSIGHTNGTQNPAGAPPLDWWEIPTEPYPGAHYATWPKALCVQPIKAMCPERVCVVCGAPSRRIVGETSYDRTDSDRVPARLAMLDGERVADGVNQYHRPNGANTSVVRQAETIGWTECDCEDPCLAATQPNAIRGVSRPIVGRNRAFDIAAVEDDPLSLVSKWRPGVVLDPFAGSGTTLAVAHGHGRSAIGIDLDERNAWLARDRVGLWWELAADPPRPVMEATGPLIERTFTSQEHRPEREGTKYWQPPEVVETLPL